MRNIINVVKMHKAELFNILVFHFNNLKEMNIIFGIKLNFQNIN